MPKNRTLSPENRPHLARPTTTPIKPRPIQPQNTPNYLPSPKNLPITPKNPTPYHYLTINISFLNKK
ncbi:MAG: hypothetical protein ACR2NY_05160 [Alphaproteobacteria bacterium]